jgi:hypothetical protein
MISSLEYRRMESRQTGLAAASAIVDRKIGNGRPQPTLHERARCLDASRRAQRTADEMNNSHEGRANAAVSRSFFGGAA